jgi:hypothetical protein
MENANESNSSKRLILLKFSIEQGMLNRKGHKCFSQVLTIKDLVLKDYHDNHVLDIPA